MPKYKAYLLDKYLEENNMSRTQFCKENKLAIETVRTFQRTGTGIGLIPILKIANVLKISLSDFIDEETPQ